MVVVDSSIWIHYLRTPKANICSALQRLIDTNRALMVGVVFAAVLQGARSEREYATLLPLLEAIPYQEMTRLTWASAGRLALQLRTEGRLIPLTDMAVAATALEGEHEVFTLDEHFNRVPGLRLHTPTVQ